MFGIVVIQLLLTILTLILVSMLFQQQVRSFVRYVLELERRHRSVCYYPQQQQQQQQPQCRATNALACVCLCIPCVRRDGSTD